MREVEDSQDSQLVTCQTEELVLTIRSVSQKDSGFYWCGVKDGSRYVESITSRLIVVGEFWPNERNAHYQVQKHIRVSFTQTGVINGVASMFISMYRARPRDIFCLLDRHSRRSNHAFISTAIFIVEDQKEPWIAMLFRVPKLYKQRTS